MEKYALTFSEGPDEVTTPLFLDLLAKYDQKATFFVRGDKAVLVKGFYDLLKRMDGEGHEVGYHGHKQVSFAQMRYAEAKAELVQAKVHGPIVRKLFRPPWGAYSKGVARACKKLGWKIVLWDAKVWDWKPRKSEFILDSLHTSVEPGIILLLHDAHPTVPRDETLKALEEFFIATKEKFRSVVVTELDR